MVIFFTRVHQRMLVLIRSKLFSNHGYLSRVQKGIGFIDLLIEYIRTSIGKLDLLEKLHKVILMYRLLEQ